MAEQTFKERMKEKHRQTLEQAQRLVDMLEEEKCEVFAELKKMEQNASIHIPDALELCFFAYAARDIGSAIESTLIEETSDLFENLKSDEA